MPTIVRSAADRFAAIHRIADYLGRQRAALDITAREEGECLSAIYALSSWTECDSNRRGLAELTIARIDAITAGDRQRPSYVPYN